jgi:uncharacterized protein (TIGR03083 family)
MPTFLTPDEHIKALRASGERLIELATVAGLGAAVPSCPDWLVRDLVAHQSKVHRWAAANVGGDDPALVPTDAEILGSVDDLASYYRDGLAGLCLGLEEAPDDLEAMTFLNDAPAPRAFWARRQAHETTIHMADALAATLGRLPTVDEADIAPELAADGIDELLRGFFTRGRSKLYDGSEHTLDVVASDVDRRWALQIGPRLTVAPHDEPAAGGAPDATIAGTAAGLYLGLWNRGTDIAVTGPSEVLDRWRTSHQVTWT